jgi:phospholipid-binding lipoprotein MlaA
LNEPAIFENPETGHPDSQSSGSYKQDDYTAEGNQTLGDFMAFEEVPGTAEGPAYADEPWPADGCIASASQQDEEDLAEEEPLDTIADPLEPVNRAFFAVNDKLYFWILKPVAQAYTKITPKKVRTGVKNFFHNLGFPVRFVNCLLQFKGEGAAMEFGRFLVNSTIGMGGVMDVATEGCHFKSYEEDFGQTLQFYGLNPGFYIDWPILGPSSFTDSIGMAGDSFLDPLKYAKIRSRNRLYARAFKEINDASFLIGEYEALKESALDPYIALRDAYYQHRKKQIKE